MQKNFPYCDTQTAKHKNSSAFKQDTKQFQSTVQNKKHQNII